MLKIKLFSNVKRCFKHESAKNTDLKLGIILGSGIEVERDRISGVKIIEEDLKGIHRKCIYTCFFEGAPVIIFQGRKHFYEGYNNKQLVETIHKAGKSGVRNLIITNASGGLNENFEISDLMLIRSHINLNYAMRNVSDAFPYNKMLAELFMESCKKAKVNFYEGVYGYYQGPTYETKAEIRFQKKFLIDAAGMSTIPEVTEANKCGIKVIAVSVITNILMENNIEPATHEAVLMNAFNASKNLNKVLSVLIPQLN